MEDTDRGWLRGCSLAELEAKIARPPYRLLWDRLTQRTRDLIRAARESNFTVGGGAGLGWHGHTPMVLEAALMHRLTGDADALCYVEECIDHTDAFSRRSLREKDVAPIIHSHYEVAGAADMVRASLGPAARQKLLAFMREVCIDFRKGRDAYVMYSGGSNIPLCQNAAAAMCALLWGGDCGHPRWREAVDEAIAHTRCYLRRGCDASGYSYEGTGYGHGVFHIIFMLAELLKQAGYADLYRTEPVLRQTIEASLRSLFPDRSFLTNDNDVGLGGAQSMWYLLPAHREWQDPLHLGFWYEYQGPDHPIRPYGDMLPWLTRFCGSKGPEADPLHSLFFTVLYWDAEAPWTPVAEAGRPTAHYSPGTETASFRTSWGRDAVFVQVQGAGRSHASMTHRHADAGHFSIFASGDYLVVDTGRYNTDEDQHNVVLVDGRCQTSRRGQWGAEWLGGRVSHYQQAEHLCYARVDAAQMKGCYWADRHFVFVPFGEDEAYIVTIDNLNRDHGKHSYWWQMHANPDFSFGILGEHSAVLNGQSARLDITFAVPGPEDFPQEPHAFSLRQDVKDWQWPYGTESAGQLEHRTSWLLNTCLDRPRLIGELTGLNGHLMAVIVPRRRDQPAIGVRQVPGRRLLHIEVDCGGFTDTLIAALDHGCIECDCMTAMTELAWLRRDRRGEVVGVWTVDGSEVLLPKSPRTQPEGR